MTTAATHILHVQLTQMRENNTHGRDVANIAICPSKLETSGRILTPRKTKNWRMHMGNGVDCVVPRLENRRGLLLQQTRQGVQNGVGKGTTFLLVNEIVYLGNRLTIKV